MNSFTTGTQHQVLVSTKQKASESERKSANIMYQVYTTQHAMSEMYYEIRCSCEKIITGILVPFYTKKQHHLFLAIGTVTCACCAFITIQMATNP